MKPIKIIEFKAHCRDHGPIATYLERENARYIGEDHQLDTYFNVPEGRLKLREGCIERKLIYYHRPDQVGPKQSDVMLYPVGKEGAVLLRGLLTQALGVKVVVDKRRHIYFIENIKIHLDRVEKLGTFVEVEAIDETGAIEVEALRTQCERLLHQFEVAKKDLISNSYSDMLLALAATQ